METTTLELSTNMIPAAIQLETHYRRSVTMGKLVAALAKAQLEFEKVLKEAENEGFKRNGKASKYATLDAVIKATRGPMAKNELVILALPDSVGADGKLRLTSLLIHSSEEFIESTLTMAAVDKLTPQQVGTLLTYGRRYQWSSLTGVAPEDDDDGNTASGVGSKETAQAVGERKVEELKAKKAQAEKGPDQLCCYPAGDAYEVTGMPDVMNAHKELLIAYGKITSKQPPIVTMSAEGLDAFKHEFQDNRGGTLVSLKGRKVAEAATALAEANSGKY